MDFKKFLIESEKDENEKDVKESLKKLPKSHSALVKDYKVIFQGGNNLKGDGEHIGYIDEEKKTITIAAPWCYGREYAFLHEVGHAVWKFFMTDALKGMWKAIVENTKNRQHQGMEEIFCMAYSNHYSKHKDVIHTHEKWEEFIKGLPK